MPVSIRYNAPDVSVNLHTMLRNRPRSSLSPATDVCHDISAQVKSSQRLLVSDTMPLMPV